MKLMQTLIRKFTELKRFIYFVICHFIEDDCTYRASALAFTTLLSIVPLMSVGFTIFANFTIFKSYADPVQDFIFANFVPATGKIVQNYLHTFAAQVTKLSAISIGFLFIVALLVMYTIESAMNKIWRIHTSRHSVYAFFLYWAIISLTPVLLGLSLAASSYLFSTPFFINHELSRILIAFPFFLSLAGFTFLYVVFPNCSVRLIYGLMGGAVAAILFESAKFGFAYYLSHYNTYQLLYGAFASLPIFFAWVYWVWLITLLGAEICYALSVQYQRRIGHPLDGFTHALIWLYKLRLAKLKGHGLTMKQLINTSKQPYVVNVIDMAEQLTSQGLITCTNDYRYVLSCDLNKLTFFELTQKLPYHLPRITELAHSKDPLEKIWKPYIENADGGLKQTLDISLEKVFNLK